MRTISIKLDGDLGKIIPDDRKIYFLCIGTDRSTGDAYGPLVGTMLSQAGVSNVIGTLRDPTHAMNLANRIASIPKDAFTIAIDACLGYQSSIGQIKVRRGPLSPGAGVGKNIGLFGDASISAVVNVAGFMEYFVLQNTRLSLIVDLASVTAEHIIDVICEYQLVAATSED